MRIQPGTHEAPCSITPNRRRGKRSEDAVEDQRGERLHGRVRDRHVVDGAEVLGAAVEVGHRGQPVLEVVRVEELAAAAHVEDDRDARLLGLGPDGIEADVARRVPARAGRGDEQRLASEVDVLARHVSRAIEVAQRHVARRQQPAVDRAEVEHRPVVGAREAVGEVDVVAVLGRLELRVHEGVEDELALEAEQIERPRAVLLDEGSRGAPVLAQQDLGLVRAPASRARGVVAGARR